MVSGQKLLEANGVLVCGHCSFVKVVVVSALDIVLGNLRGEFLFHFLHKIS